MKKNNFSKKYVAEQELYAALETVKEAVLCSHHKQIHSFHRFVEDIRENIIKSNSPLQLKNLFYFVFSEKPADLKSAKELFVRKCNFAQLRLKQDKDKLINNILSKISYDSKILTHGFCDELVEAVKKASEQGKKVSLVVSDSPFSEVGKEFAKKLLKKNVNLQFYPIAALRQALKTVDFIILNAEAITDNKIVTEMGGELIAELASKSKIPFFVISHSWKKYGDLSFDSLKTSVKNSLKGSHSFFYHSFEQVSPSLVSGVISERGTHNHSVFVELVEKDKNKM